MSGVRLAAGGFQLAGISDVLVELCTVNLRILCLLARGSQSKMFIMLEGLEMHPSE